MLEGEAAAKMLGGRVLGCWCHTVGLFCDCCCNAGHGGVLLEAGILLG